MSAVMALARPIAAMRMSADRVTCGRSLVPVWQTVTVALAPILLLHQEHGDRLANDVAAAAHHNALALRAVACAHQELLNACGSARHEHRPSLHQMSHVHGVQAVHILVRVQGSYYQALVYLWRKWQLHQDAVKAVVPVELLHLLYHLALGAVLGQIECLREDPNLAAGALLVADVDRGCWVVAHQDRRQARSVPVLGGERLNAPRNFAAYVLGNPVAVDYKCAQVQPPAYSITKILAHSPSANNDPVDTP